MTSKILSFYSWLKNEVITVLLILLGDQLTSRSGSFGGCSIGGRDYPDGSWVPVGGLRICRCRRGIVRAPCEGRKTQQPSSFPVGLSFGTSSRGDRIENRTIGGINKSIAAVSFKTPIVRLENKRKQIVPKEKKVTKRRLTSGKGTAKLFKLFPEVKEPVVRTSNKTGCHVGGEFYEYPTITQSMSACRCVPNHIRSFAHFISPPTYVWVKTFAGARWKGCSGAGKAGSRSASVVWSGAALCPSRELSGSRMGASVRVSVRARWRRGVSETMSCSIMLVWDNRDLI